jgi:hypothetical protein
MPRSFASTRLPVLPARGGIDRLLEDLLGVLLGDLLDIHAAFGRRHHGDAAGGAVEQHAEVVLVLDREALLDEQALDLLALGAGLRRDELHPEDLLHGLFGIRARLRDLHAAALAATTCVNLRLDDDDLGAALLLHLRDRRERFFNAQRRDADRHRHAVLLEQLLSLVLVDLHERGCITARARSA